MLKGEERRYLGHNPAGGAMAIILLTALAGLTVTGWFATLTAKSYVVWMKEAHEGLASLTMVFIVWHVMGVVLASIRQRENLVRSIIAGGKRAGDGNNIK